MMCSSRIQCNMLSKVGAKMGNIGTRKIYLRFKGEASFSTIVCSRSVGRGLRAVVYVMVKCSYFAYTSQLTVCP